MIVPDEPLQPADRAKVLWIRRLPHRPEGKTVLDLLDGLSLLMDRLFQVPGTRLRFGLNSLLLMLPVLGDVIPTLISAAILAIGLSHHRVPRIVAVRMVFNTLLDAALGWIPVFGDLFDLWFKADTRNVRLLIEYAGRDVEQSPTTWRHWLILLGALAAVLLILTLVVLGSIYLVHLLIRAATPAS
jgi:uncharacterized protein DUF4112